MRIHTQKIENCEVEKWDRKGRRLFFSALFLYSVLQTGGGECLKASSVVCCVVVIVVLCAVCFTYTLFTFKQNLKV